MRTDEGTCKCSDVAERLYHLMSSVLGGGGRLANISRILITGKVQERIMNKTWPPPLEFSFSTRETNT